MIETERLILRPPALEDAEPMHAIYADVEVMRHISGKASTSTESWARLLRTAGHWQLLGYGFFTVIEKETGTLVGNAGFARMERGLGADFDDFPEAGWVFGRAAHGKGYATEAMTAAHQWFDREHGAQRSVCIISPDHARSVRVAEKLGYKPFDSRIFPGTEDDWVTLFARCA